MKIFSLRLIRPLIARRMIAEPIGFAFEARCRARAAMKATIALGSSRGRNAVLEFRSEPSAMRQRGARHLREDFVLVLPEGT